MHNIVVDALSVPATTAPVERIFSRASYILSKKTMIGMHICICKNCIYAIFLACIYAYAMQYAFVFEYAICYAYAFNMNMQYAICKVCILHIAYLGISILCVLASCVAGIVSS